MSCIAKTIPGTVVCNDNCNNCHWWYEMTVEEAKQVLEFDLEHTHNDDSKEALRIAIKVLEQESYIDAISRFVKWVATEIFDDMWEYNKDAFAEIACRKLSKLGIVRATGNEWELVEPQESEDKE